MSTFSANAIPGKVGYQNPNGYPQVSRFNVVLPLYVTDPQWSFVMPSRISVNASRSQCIETFISVAYEYMAKGTPWVDNHCSYPGNQIDCSGMIMEGLYACGMSLDGARGGDFNPYTKYYWHHHFANTWRANGTFRRVALTSIQRGDILYYSGHVAIYLGNGQIIDAFPGTNVSVRSVYAPSRILGAARPFV